MPFPAGLQTVTVNCGPYLTSTGSPAKGRVRLAPMWPLTHEPSGSVILASTAVGVLDSDGKTTITVPASDAAGLTRPGVRYLASVDLGPGMPAPWEPFLALLPAATPSVDLDRLQPAVDAAGAAVSLPTVTSVAGLSGPLTAEQMAGALETPIGDRIGAAGNPIGAALRAALRTLVADEIGDRETDIGAAGAAASVAAVIEASNTSDTSLFAALLAAGFGPPFPTAGLVGYWDFATPNLATDAAQQTVPSLYDINQPLQLGTGTGVDSSDPTRTAHHMKFTTDDGLYSANLAAVNMAGDWTALLYGLFDGTGGNLWALVDPTASNKYQTIQYSSGGAVVQVQSRDATTTNTSTGVVNDRTKPTVYAVQSSGGNVTLTRMDTGVSNTVVNRNPTGTPRLSVGCVGRNGTQVNANSVRGYAHAFWNRALTPQELADAARSMTMRHAPRETFTLGAQATSADINNTIAQMKGGDRLILTGTSYTPDDGSFNGLPSGLPGRPTEVHGNGATINGGTTQMWLQNKSRIDVEGLHFRGFTTGGQQCSSCTDINFTDCSWASTAVASISDCCLLTLSSRITYTRCEVGPLPNTTVDTCDGFECNESCVDITYTDCVAHGIKPGTAEENHGHGFEAYTSGAPTNANIRWINCEAYDCRVGFSAEGAPSPHIVADGCIAHDNEFYDFQGKTGGVLIIRNHTGGVVSGAVTIES